MRATMSAVVVTVLIATQSPVRLIAAGDAFGVSIEAAAKTFASSEAASDTKADAAWRRLANLPSGTRIVIRTRDGQIVHAAVREADDGSLTTTTGTFRRSFDRADVVEVTFGPKGSGAGAYIGGFLGCLVGGALGTSVSRRCHENCTEGDSRVAGLFCAGMAVGAGFAGYYGLRTPGEVIYLAP